MLHETGIQHMFVKRNGKNATEKTLLKGTGKKGTERNKRGEKHYRTEQGKKHYNCLLAGVHICIRYDSKRLPRLMLGHVYKASVALEIISGVYQWSL